jgi:AraC family transcriptional regulator, transcriptional activator of pobA
MIFNMFNISQHVLFLHLDPKYKLHLNGHVIGNGERSFYHFSFLKDIKIHGIYLNSVTGYLSLYPFMNRPHYHDFYSVVLIRDGHGSFSICNTAYEIKPNSMFLVAPNQVHSFEGIKCADGLIFFFCQDYYVEEFSFIRLLNVFSNSAGTDNSAKGPLYLLSDGSKNRLVRIIASIKNEYEDSALSGNAATVIRSLLNILMLKLAELYDITGENNRQSESTLIHSLSNLIESYFMQEHNVGFYASALNYSEKHLNELCNRHFKCGLKKILLDRLMQESRRLLLSSELSVSQIAFKMNYEDASYFNKVFSKNTGLTPKKFRDMHKKFIP